MRTTLTNMLTSTESSDDPVIFLWEIADVIYVVLWLWYCLRLKSRWCNKVIILSFTPLFHSLLIYYTCDVNICVENRSWHTYAKHLVLPLKPGVTGSSASGVARQPMEETGIQWVERTLESSDDCYDMFWMHGTVFHRLHETLANDYGLVASREVSTKEALAIFLWACGALII
jgi:hypothetical protein